MSLSTRTFCFIRHGETEWNVLGRLQGHTDTPLNATGLRQAREAALLLGSSGVTRIITSPLSRAAETAKIINDFLKLPLTTDPDLMERHFGPWEGLFSMDIRQQHGLTREQSITSILPPDAEQWPVTCDRITSAVHKGLAAYPTDKILFVSHGSVFRALHECLCGVKREAANAVPYRFTRQGKIWRMEDLHAQGKQGNPQARARSSAG